MARGRGKKGSRKRFDYESAERYDRLAPLARRLVRKGEMLTQNEVPKDLIEFKAGEFINERIAIAVTKTGERTQGLYASWVAVFVNFAIEGMPFVVWNVLATENGFVAQNGDYCSTLDEALGRYRKRGGKA